MDLDRVHRWLSTDAFWALGRSRETVDTAARHSLNFGAFAGDGSQVAYARVVADYATFAWLCDVYVDREHRGCGLGTHLSFARCRDHRGNPEFGFRDSLSWPMSGRIVRREGGNPSRRGAT
jgi:GNAT superfamily N-acetyltransferase